MDQPKRIITETFTYDDIIDVMMQDRAFVVHKLEDLNNKCERYIKKKKPKDPFNFKPVHFVSNRGLNYSITIHFHGIKDYKAYGPTYSIYAYQRKSDGYHAFFYASGEMKQTEFLIYTPHFFNRYRERQLKDMTVPMKDVMDTFFCNNSRTFKQDQNNERYPDGIIIESPEGIGLGLKYNTSDSIHVIKTFISIEMLKGTQIEMSENARDELQKIVDDIVNLRGQNSIYYGYSPPYLQ